MNTPKYTFDREPSDDELLAAIANPFDIEALEKPYRIANPRLFRPQDDSDGVRSDGLSLTISGASRLFQSQNDTGGKRDTAASQYQFLLKYGIHPGGQGCFRHAQEGSASVRTGNALRLAWYAIHLEDRGLAEDLSKQIKQKVTLEDALRILETTWMPDPWFRGAADDTQKCMSEHSLAKENEMLWIHISKEDVRMGDVYVTVFGPQAGNTLSFQSVKQGGKHPLVYNALHLLALGMHLDNALGAPRGHSA